MKNGRGKETFNTVRTYHQNFAKVMWSIFLITFGEVITFCFCGRRATATSSQSKVTNTFVWAYQHKRFFQKFPGIDGSQNFSRKTREKGVEINNSYFDTGRVELKYIYPALWDRFPSKSASYIVEPRLGCSHLPSLFLEQHVC